MLHDEMWQANADLAQKCLAHPFVRGLGDGSLERAAFRRYVAQDAFFLRGFLRAYAVAAAKCEELAHARALHRFMGGALEELELHASYARKLGNDLEDVQPLPACRAYVDFLMHTAWQRGPDVTLAAMAPCMRLYAFLGQQLAPQQRPGHPYGDWIDTYSSAAFATLADQVDALLDEVAADTPAVRAAYRYAMQCELAFFGAPLEPAP
jgi:thiaminase/transcriptional activator TenA